MTTSIVIIDSNDIIRLGLTHLLRKDTRFDIAGESITLTDGLSKIIEYKPGIAIIDFKFSDGDAILAVKRIHEINPSIKVLLFTDTIDKQLLLELMKFNIAGVLLKSRKGKQILKALEKISCGEHYYDSEFSDILLQSYQVTSNRSTDIFSTLTNREISIMNLLNLGYSNKEIAFELQVAEKTIRNNLTKIMEKLNVSNRTEAALLWNRYF